MAKNSAPKMKQLGGVMYNPPQSLEVAWTYMVVELHKRENQILNYLLKQAAAEIFKRELKTTSGAKGSAGPRGRMGAKNAFLSNFIANNSGQFCTAEIADRHPHIPDVKHTLYDMQDQGKIQRIGDEIGGKWFSRKLLKNPDMKQPASKKSRNGKTTGLRTAGPNSPIALKTYAFVKKNSGTYTSREIADHIQENFKTVASMLSRHAHMWHENRKWHAE